MAENEIRFVGDMERLQFRAGDRLVLKTEQRISAETAARMKQELEQWLNDDTIKVIVLGDGMSLGVLGPET
jgi:hypothetical protein